MIIVCISSNNDVNVLNIMFYLRMLLYILVVVTNLIKSFDIITKINDEQSLVICIAYW